MGTAVANASEQTVSYIPLGAKTSVDLTIGRVRSFLCTPTKSGVAPSDADVIKFIKLCQARELDPWVGDAYLVGYDSRDGATFSLITAQQALLKRAEINSDYDGMESGVIVEVDGKIEFRPGDFTSDGEKLLGGWARVFRKNHGTPSYDSVKLSTYNSGRSRWAADPAGMIVKVAESSALRKAFPTQLGGMYTREEMEVIQNERIAARGPVDQTKKVAYVDAVPAAKPVEDTPALIEHSPQVQQVNPYAADFAKCKDHKEVVVLHGELMATPDGEQDKALIEAAAKERKAQLK